ncbi:putative sugar transferase [Anaerovibrio sp. JC8]|uniref:hypothetical protein n=1 Tax=Anaerovibrio sp. JC8 TaxID=1240085 RepID=UPI000A0E3979|nr:hypothetical protein [Anaerovibrio sp. JC8]ORU00520.1 putative sugar transferase [Anaerovibrio sp. JC8]
MLYSFDIFDTLITRRTATPAGIFAIMQHRLQNEEKYHGISAEIRNRFYDLRVGAESLARNYRSGVNVEEVTLPEIYKAMATTGEFNEIAIEQLMALEKEIELQNVVGVEENIANIKKLVEEGNRVILIADTYLDEAIVRNMLNNADSVFADIPIYVSSIWRKCKSSGSLYELIRRKEQVAYSEWRHVGDEESADVKVPEWLGIQAKQYHFSALWGVEKRYLEQAAYDSAAQLAIGTAKNLRLKHKDWSNPSVVGVSVGGAILFPYVNWVIRRSQEMGVHRLYFIARDGFVLKQIADEIIKKWDLPIETHYVYGSRRTWRMAGYDGSEAQLKRLLNITRPWVASKARKIADIADVLEISIDKMKPFLPEHWPDTEHLLYTETFNWLGLYLAQQSEFREFLKKQHSEKRKLALDYLCQEIGFAKDDFAFVELVGTGFTSECMVDIIHDTYEKPVKIFYYNLFGDGIEGKAQYYNFQPKILSHSMLLELLCRALHGQTVAYSGEIERIIPVTVNDQKEKDILTNYGYDKYLSAVGEFSKSYMDCYSQYSLVPSAKMSYFYLDDVGETPDKNVLDFFADMPFEDTGYSDKIKKFAPILTDKDIRNLFLLNPDYSQYKGSDIHYSLLRCDTWENNKIAWYQRNRGKIIKRYKQIWGKDLLPPEDIYAAFRGFPFRAVGEKYVIYGAGVLGHRIYSAATKMGCEIVGWLDKNYKQFREEGQPVTGTIDNLTEYHFDVVWIAVYNPWIAGEVKDEMLKIGISEDKIMYFGKWRL